MLFQNFDNIDEQLQALEAICGEAYEKYKIYDNEFESLTKKGAEINQDLIDKLNKALTDHKKTVDKWHTLQKLCAINQVDLTTHWIRLGFTEAQIKKIEEERQNSLLQV